MSSYLRFLATCAVLGASLGFMAYVGYFILKEILFPIFQ